MAAEMGRVRTYRSDMEGPRPFYCLMMFPYPSAEKLHIGNAYVFTGADSTAATAASGG